MSHSRLEKERNTLYPK